jgi:predicted ferric reductase
VRYSDENIPKWDESFIEKRLLKYSSEDLKKIWVCGPPQMNESFDKALEKHGPTYNITR